MKTYSPYQFSFLRMSLGIYLFIHFSMLIPYSAEIFSSAGVLASAELNRTYPYFPNILYLFDGPVFVTIFVSLLALFSLFFTLGWKRKIFAIILFYGHVALFNRNNLIANPGLPYVGWLLLVFTFVPNGEPFAIFSKQEKLDDGWTLPAPLFWGAWIFTSVGYTISGIHKYFSVSWFDGTALIHLLNSPLAREHFLRHFFESLPVPLLKTMCWFLLASEILYAPMALWKKTRVFAYLFMVIMHFGILAIVDFADLTLGVLMIHLFTFDGRWISAKACNGTIVFNEDNDESKRFVNFVKSEDRDHVFKFSSDSHKTKTLMLVDDTGTYSGIDAIIRIFQQMGNIWGIFNLLKIIPKPIYSWLVEKIPNTKHKSLSNK